MSADCELCGRTSPTGTVRACGYCALDVRAVLAKRGITGRDAETSLESAGHRWRTARWLDRHAAMVDLFGHDGIRAATALLDELLPGPGSDADGLRAARETAPRITTLATADPDDDKTACDRCGDRVYCTSSRGWCDGCEEETEPPGEDRQP